MKDKALKTVCRERLFPPGSHVTAALSGGADSVALLCFLNVLRAEWGISLSACHLNHGLRGEESLRDESFCRALCRDLEIPLAVRREDVAARAGESGESVEECARRLRYAFFKEQAKALGGVVATAHTLTDRTETMLINLLRGTGLRGLCSIPFRRGVFVRPLLDCTREETEAYCRENGLAYVTDSSNLSRDYTRNRIRLDVLPVFRQLNPGFFSCAGRALENLSQDEEYLEEKAREAASLLQRGEGLDCAGLAQLPRALSFRVLRAFLRERALPYDEGKIRLLLACAEKGSGAVELAGGRFVKAQGGVLAQELHREPSAAFEVPAGPGKYEMPGGVRLSILLQSYEEFEKTVNNDRNLLKNGIDYDRIKNTLWIRQKKAGDFFHPAGRGVGKTLKKLFQESGVPAPRRGGIPVLADGGGVVWAAGFGCDERVLPRPGCSRVLYVTVAEPYPQNGAAPDDKNGTKENSCEK
ncbi:MAG: tRNA lysidine(34) synthetase TilS [Oscillospiraceae bacterium]|nr:tRNA lysidine(34) synthetase TilS [Oscillospiraceae bacterium]